MKIDSADKLAKKLGLEGCDEESLSSWAYENTECGASIFISDTGITVSSIVEGLDGEASEFLKFPFTMASFRDTLKDIDDRVNELWNETHGCSDCATEQEGDFKAVDPACKTCMGKGVPI